MSNRMVSLDFRTKLVFDPLSFFFVTDAICLVEWINTIKIQQYIHLFLKYFFIYVFLDEQYVHLFLDFTGEQENLTSSDP